MWLEFMICKFVAWILDSDFDKSQVLKFHPKFLVSPFTRSNRFASDFFCALRAFAKSSTD